MTEAVRARVVAEARTWIGTPFHSGGRLKGVGVDCGQMPLLVYEAVGVIPHYDSGYYPPDYHLHHSEEWYLLIVERFGEPIPGPPRAGDFALWKFGRCFSHGGIVVDWPRVIHASNGVGKVLEDDSQQAFFRDRMGGLRPVLFFDGIGD